MNFVSAMNMLCEATTEASGSNTAGSNKRSVLERREEEHRVLTQREYAMGWLRYAMDSPSIANPYTRSYGTHASKAQLQALKEVAAARQDTAVAREEEQDAQDELSKTS